MKSFSKRMQPWLGTFVEIGLSAEPDLIENAFRKAFATIEDIHKRLSFHEAKSELSILNTSHGQWIKMSKQSIVLLRLAKRLTKASNLVFNFSLGGKLVRQNLLPNHGFQKFEDFGSYNDLEIQGTRARLKKAVLINVDGIAKGYAVDLAYKALAGMGVVNGWINAGGDIRIFGDCILPIHRREADGSLCLLGEYQNTSLATSQVGSLDTRAMGRIVSSSTQKVEPGIWTIQAKSAWLADALTKVACQIPYPHNAKTVNQLGGLLIEPSSLERLV